MFCVECEKECSVHEEDHGYGSGEAWGQPYNHVVMVLVSDCCGAEVKNDLEDRDTVAYEDWAYDRACDYADYLYDLRKDRG